MSRPAIHAGFWPAITRRQSPPSSSPRLSSLGSSECDPLAWCSRPRIPAASLDGTLVTFTRSQPELHITSTHTEAVLQRLGSDQETTQRGGHEKDVQASAGRSGHRAHHRDVHLGSSHSGVGDRRRLEYRRAVLPGGRRELPASVPRRQGHRWRLRYGRRLRAVLQERDRLCRTPRGRSGSPRPPSATTRASATSSSSSRTTASRSS